MRLYVTSTDLVELGKPRTVRMVYLGTSVGDAERAVRLINYEKSEEHFPSVEMRKAYSALPRSVEREMIQFYMNGGLWYSIETFEIEEQNAGS